MPKPGCRQLCLIVAMAFACVSTEARAGTTGSVSGTVLEADVARTPIANARVTVAGPSQTLTTTTDRKGRFTFLSLAPDAYTLSTEKQGYDPIVLSGVSAVADQNQTEIVTMQRTEQEIGHVQVRAKGSIVQPGVTADAYSLGPQLAEKAQALGGGGALNQAYSALALLPGVVVPPGQNGWNQLVYIRGSNSDQTGFEYDGVPINRAFDNYPTSTASSLGQQELQLYPGGGPAGSVATGTGGFINQVIRTGTYPGFAEVTLGVGTPTYGQNIRIEAGGASPDRNFSYYLGFLGSGQDFRDINQFNGAGSPVLGAPLSVPGPFGTGVAPACARGAMGNCYFLGPIGFEAPAQISDHEFVGNFHVGIPHHGDTGKDDVQVLYSNSLMGSAYADSVNDLIADGVFPAGTSVPYVNGMTFPNGTQFGQTAAGLKPVSYGFPSAYPGDANVNPSQTDGFTNNDSIVKVQYQKNFGSSAYARVYGYTLYSDWLANGATAVGADSLLSPGFLPLPLFADYELSTHTRGLGFQFADQISPEHLLQFNANLTSATSTRWNNETMFTSTATPATNLADAAGNCYDAAGQRATCNSESSDPTYGTFGNPTPFTPPAGSPAAVAGAHWIVTTPGQQGSYNTVSPQFSSFSLMDTWRPSDKLSVNGGLRFEQFQYDLASANTPGQNFWATAAQNEVCYNPSTSAFDGFALTCGAGDLHPNGQNGAALYSNSYPSSYTATAVEPRISAAYTVNSDTVFRGSYGRYAQPADTASIQYTAFQPNTPGAFYGDFSQSGLASSPVHEIAPAVSSNYDFSFEKHIKGTDMSLKLTPFFRLTQNALQNVYLDQVENFVSSINAGTQKTNGIELQFTKGDFDRDGWAMSVSYTYTDSKIKYQDIGDTSINPIDQINAAIQKYNAFTAAGGGSPCYTAGAPSACTSTAIGNPYYSAKPQALLNPNGWYVPFNTTPAVNNSAQVSYLIPHVVSFTANYKRKRLAITPSVQIFAGQPYGAPLNQIGWNPTSCTGNQLGIPSAVAAGRGQYADWTTCSAYLNIPNYETGTFDAQGAYTEPIDLQTNLRISYEASKRVKLTFQAINILNRCFGGSKEPWTTGGAGVCGYGLDGSGGGQGISNFYNGASPFDAAANGGATALPYNAHAYTAQAGGNPVVPTIQPFELYLGAQIDL